MPASDNFCRSCGCGQPGRKAATADNGLRRDISTTILSHSEESRYASQTISNALVNTIAHSVAAKTAPFRRGRVAARLIAALVVLPMWLLIVLLSPLDAYVAAKAASAQLNYE
jgi:hypothetical protein